MKKRRQYIIKKLQEEHHDKRRYVSTMMFLCGIIGGMIVGKCSNQTQTPNNFKHGVIAPDSGKTFQAGDTVKIILINEKQR